MKNIIWFLFVFLPVITPAHADSSNQREKQRILQLYQIAQKANESGDFTTAINYYKDILDSELKEELQPGAITEISLGMADAYMQLRDYNKANTLISPYLEEKLPNHLHLKTHLLQARLLFQNRKFVDSHQELMELQYRFPIVEWGPKDRALLLMVENKLNQLFEHKLEQAERLFSSASYEEAIELYRQIGDAIAGRHFPQQNGPQGYTTYAKVLYRLAQSQYLLRQYQGVIDTLVALSPEILQSDPSLQGLEKSAVYLFAVALRSEKMFGEAIIQFENYLSLGDRNSLTHWDQVQWELGAAHYHLGHLDQAHRYLKPIIRSNRVNGKTEALAHIYLSRIQLRKRNFHIVEKELAQLAKELPSPDPLHYEIAYLRGEALFQLKQYRAASEQLEKSIPSRNTHQADWQAKALLNLGWCYLKIAEDKTLNPEQIAHYLDLSEKVLNKVMSIKPHEKLYLVLAKVYLQKGNLLGDKEALLKVETLLSHQDTFASLNARAQSYLLRAEAAISPHEQDKLYQELLSDTFAGTTAYNKGWYYWALQRFSRAQALLQEGNQELGKDLLHKSLPLFTESHEHLKEAHPALAGNAIAHLARARFLLGGKEHLLLGYQQCERLMNEERAVWEAMESPDELLYLSGLIASHLIGESDTGKYRQIAVGALEELIERFDNGQWTPSALNLLGTIYFQQEDYERAEKLFVQLGNSFPVSEDAGSAWFWAAECAENLHRDPSTIRELRGRVFQLYDTSPHAAEAYFHYYSQSDYLRGVPDALAHLQKMPQKYEGDKLLVVAHFYLGLHSKLEQRSAEGILIKGRDWTGAIEHFEKAVTAFDMRERRHGWQDNNLEYYVTIRYRAMLEKAQAFYEIASGSNAAKRHIFLEYANEAFTAILNDFENPEHHLTHLLQKADNYPQLLEESEFGLAQTLVDTLEDRKAEALLAKMLQRYKQMNQQSGLYLSKAWSLQGEISMRSGDYPLAIQSFTRSEQAAPENLLSSTERLDLWIKQAKCMLALNRLPEAMRTLSRVINEDVASSKRIEAMYLRAEIYELQGRHDLAVKQLEATSHKGGKWAEKAKTRLDTNYGFVSPTYR